MHTIESVKANLPDVNVEWRGHVYVGCVRGRLNQIATVYLEQCPEVQAEYSWPSIVRAVNQGMCLSLE